MNTNILFLIFISISSGILAQSITKVDSYQEGQTIRIVYQLNSNVPVEIKAECSKDRGKSFFTLKKVTGDVGKGIKSGSKVIIWRVLEEVTELESDGIVFRVSIIDAPRIPGVYHLETNSGQNSISVNYILRMPYNKYPAHWRYSVSLSFKRNQIWRHHPKYISGDLKKVTSDAYRKTIKWDFHRDLKYPRGEYKTHLKVKHLLGPQAVVYSLIYPGLGVYKTTGGNRKPFYRGIIIGAAFTGGFFLKEYANQSYNQYETASSRDAGMRYLKQGNLLNQTGTAVLIAGLSYWLYDVTEVTIRGIRNVTLGAKPITLTQSELPKLPLLTMTWKP